MATTVTVQTPAGGGKVASYEVSGGADGDLAGAKTFSIGAVNNVVSFLTVARVGTGSIKIKAVSGPVRVSIDNGKDKPVRKGGSITLAAKNKRAVIREVPKK